MKEMAYGDFSLRTHSVGLGRDRSSVCQFELTFGCGLRCKHCYTDCYNRPSYVKKELPTAAVKRVIDRIKSYGVLWLCLTGGDPLTRKDFSDIYSYARGRGFIVTVFTNGYSMTGDVIDLFKDRPPFAVEITLNSVTERLYDEMSGVKGSFTKVMAAIDDLKSADLPLKLKTQITRDNISELSAIKTFVEGMGLAFTPNPIIYPRLDGDTRPCALRAAVADLAVLYGFGHRACGERAVPVGREDVAPEDGGTEGRGVFPCAIESGDGINIDPYGNLFPCTLIRRPRIDILSVPVPKARARLMSALRGRRFETGSECSSCGYRRICASCPGKAIAETGDPESTVGYYCELARAMEGRVV